MQAVMNLCEQFPIYFMGGGGSKICFSQTYTRSGYFLPRVECVHNSSSTNDTTSVVLGVSHQKQVNVSMTPTECTAAGNVAQTSQPHSGAITSCT